MPGLTPRQQSLYDFILDHIERLGYQPTVREMSDHFGIGLNAIEGHLQKLEQLGFIEFSGKSRGLHLRGIRFVRQASDALGVAAPGTG